MVLIKSQGEECQWTPDSRDQLAFECVKRTLNFPVLCSVTLSGSAPAEVQFYWLQQFLWIYPGDVFCSKGLTQKGTFPWNKWNKRNSDMEILLVVPAIIDYQAKDNHFLIICLLNPNGCLFPSAHRHRSLWWKSSTLITSRNKSCS